VVRLEYASSKRFNPTRFCTGTLLSAWDVLSSANCFTGDFISDFRRAVGTVYAVMGSETAHYDEQGNKEIRIAVAAFYPQHPSYTKSPCRWY